MVRFCFYCFVFLCRLTSNAVFWSDQSLLTLTPHQRRHVHSNHMPPFLRQVDFEYSFQKTKNNSYFYMQYDHRGRKFGTSPAAKFKSESTLWLHWARDMRFYSAAHYSQSHTILLSLRIRGVQWVSSECGHCLNSVLWWILQKQQSADVRTM